MSTYSVAQNTSFLTVASILQKVVSFVYFTLIARVIGVEDTGQYFFAIAFTAVFAVIADFGFSSVLTREISRAPEKTDSYFSTVFRAKVLFGLAAYLLVIFFVFVLQYSATAKILICLSGITMLFDNLHSCFYAVFRAKKNLIYESVGVVGSQILTLAVGTVALYLHWPLYWLILAYTIPSFANMIYSGTFLFARYRVRFFGNWSTEIFKIFLPLSAPFALSGLVSRLQAYGDSMIMSKMLTPEALGFWSVPYKITFAFQFLPVALSASVYPVASELFLKNKEKISELYSKSCRYLFILSLPICFGLGVLAQPIIYYLFGEAYAPSVSVLTIILPGIFFSFMALINGAVLNAVNRQKIQTAITTGALVLSVVLNLILLPRFGIIGAAISSFASNLFFCASGLYYVKKFIGFSGSEILKTFLQVFFAALPMAIITFYLAQKINFLLTIPVAVVVYAILLFVFGGMTKDLVLDAKNKIFKKQSV